MMDEETQSFAENEPLIVSNNLTTFKGGFPQSPASPGRLQRPVKDWQSLEVVAVFVVAFDTNKGNVLEWCRPDFMKQQLSGLEFKAMPSGAHTLDSDYVYLYETDLYGVACYQRLSVDSRSERGARMKSVGVLCHTYEPLEAHRAGLQPLVSHVLEQPGDYSPLNSYYERWTGNIQANNPSLMPAVGSSATTPLALTHPDECFEEMLRLYGSQLFTVWKALVLQKRVLIYSPPPAARICQQVYCCTRMMCELSRLRVNMCTPFFYVNIADCDTLATQLSYVACTTEKVFELKPNIYDVFVDASGVKATVRVASDRLSRVLRPTSGDTALLKRLCATMRQSVTLEGSEDGEPLTPDDLFFSYFSSLNAAVADRVREYDIADKLTLSRQDVRRMGLCADDAPFITELMESMNLDVRVGCTLCSCYCLA